MNWTLEHKLVPGTTETVTDNGKHTINYDEDDVKTLELENENWKFNNSVNGLKAGTSKFNMSPKSREQKSLSEMFSDLGKRSSLQNQAQTFDQLALVNACRKEEENSI